MEEQNVEYLKGSVQQGVILEDFCRHAGFQILKRELERKIQDSKNEWLKAKSSQEAEEIRIKTKPYQEVYDLLTHKILQGRVAQQALEKLNEKDEI